MNKNQNITRIVAGISRAENAKLFLNDLLSTAEGEEWAVDGLLLLLASVEEKIKTGEAIDFIGELGFHVFAWTLAHTDSYENHLDAIKAGRNYAGDDFAPLDLSEMKPESLGTSDAPQTDLAVQLSEILRDERLPSNVYNAVSAALGEVYNELDGFTVNDFESSPEYLAFVLSAAKRLEGK